MSENTQSRDKDFHERMEFAKTQGEFFKKILEELEGQRQKYRYILDQFSRSAVQLQNFYKGGAQKDEESEQAREWPQLSLIQTTRQPMTQDRIKAACMSIVSDSSDANSTECVIIDFEKGRLIWEEMVFSLSHTIIEIEATPDLIASYDIPFGDRLRATVYMRNKDNHVQAFLKAKGDDGQEYFCELNHFSVLFLLDEDCKKMDEGRGQSERTDNEAAEDHRVEDERASREVGMFTLFDRRNNLLFVNTY